MDELDASEVKVWFGPRPGRGRYFGTWVENQSAEPVRILKFGAYRWCEGDRFELNTISNTWFTAEQFRNWYGLTQSEWIEPGQAADPNNYGSGALCAYWCESAQGDKFIAGGFDG